MRNWRTTRFWLLLGFFLSSSSSELTGGAELDVAVENGTSIHISTSAGINTQCEVCISQVCQSSVVLKSDTRLNFSCSQPENVFTVEIIRDIAERVINIVPKEYNAFKKFNRTFIWNLKPTDIYTIRLNFSRIGLRQIRPTDGCPDKHVYTIMTENVTVGRFCENGTIQNFRLRNVGKLSLEVSGGQTLSTNVIDVTLGISSESLADIHVYLPESSSTQDFFTPNNFPEDEQTSWTFTIPQTHYADVHILNHTVPTCLQPENIPTMNYRLYRLNKSLVKPLNGTQPSKITSLIMLDIRNCKMSRPSQDLMVHFQISTYERTQGQCNVDLPESQMVQIHVKGGYRSTCLLKLNSVLMYTDILPSGKRILLETFDCNNDDLELTVTQTIECKEWRDCASTSFPLTFNYGQQCIPGVVKTMTWHLLGPQNSAVELQSPPDGLRYCPPEDKSKSILLLNVSHLNPGIIVGQFCPKGTIEKIQIRESSIAVTASVTGFSDRNLATKPFLTYSFTQSISEHYIFTVSHKMDNRTVLVTPAWPSGMKPSSTVSWIINTELTSNLKFRNVSQPKCDEGNTDISVQTIQSQTMVYSTKKDENIIDVLVPESFYLNMTNCKSPTGAFGAMMEITLPDNTNKLLAIILSIVGIVLMIITAVGIWIFLRKKKRKKALPVSVCNPNAFLPGLHGIPKTQEEDPYAYEYIDDTLVYSHLLKGDAENERCTDESGPPLPDRPLRKSVTECSEMIENELYGHTQGESTASGSPKSPIKPETV